MSVTSKDPALGRVLLETGVGSLLPLGARVFAGTGDHAALRSGVRIPLGAAVIFPAVHVDLSVSDLVVSIPQLS